jgi:transmembrane protein
MPNLITRLLDQQWFMVLARVLLTFPFWASGLSKLIDFQGGVAEMAQLGFNPPAAYNIATIITQLVGSALIIFNRGTWLGAGALGVFTFLTIPLVHAFWNKQGEAAIIALHTAGEHVGMIGGLILVTILSKLTSKA